MINYKLIIFIDYILISSMSNVLSYILFKKYFFFDFKLVFILIKIKFII